MIRHLPALLLAVLLAGCATHRAAPEPAWNAAELAQVVRFDIQGKVGFRRGETGGSASLLWQQDGERYRLNAAGPLGAGSLRIDGNRQRVRIESADGSRESDDPAGLLAEAIGWPVSVNSLAWWVRGLAAPDGGPAEIDHDAGGRPVRIRQQGWDILLDRWQASGGRLLPHKVVATGGDSRVTLLIQRWATPAAP